jgi:hypothetical protein
MPFTLKEGQAELIPAPQNGLNLRGYACNGDTEKELRFAASVWLLESSL